MKKLLHLLPGLSLLAALAVGALNAAPAMAQDAAAIEAAVASAVEAASTKAFFDLSNLWILISAALVFIMHLGFSAVETGLTQSKNTVNILFKNLFIITMGVLTYALWGFNAMYPGDAWAIGGWFAMGSPISNATDYGDAAAYMTAEYASYTVWSDFVFQAMFAATAATIVSGAVAERVKLGSFMIFATLLVTIAYPITGSWKWGAGWLDGMGFYDFAGSSLVHAFGGFAALACVIVLGPRKGKYLPGGKVKPILGHSMPLATIGVFLLFLGWFGFNGGSVLSADAALVSLVFVTTAVAACAGAMGAIFTSWIALKKPDLSMGLNGVLAGLVGITAGADQMGPWSAMLVGLIAGILVVFSILFLDKVKIDDPVGAISVHGTCGIWGTIAVGIFGVAAGEPDSYSFGVQFMGTLAISAFAFIFSLIVFGALKAVMGVRVSEEEEFEGLDIGEHGQEAYPDFGVTSR